MLANKFNEAVEVILELSQKVENLKEMLAKILQRETVKNHSSFLNFKLFIFFF